MGLIAPRAVLVGSYSGSTLTTKHQAEAWNPNNDQAHPTPARSGTGVYSYTFASTYKDEDGNDVTTVLLGARVLPQGEVTSYANRIVFHAWIDPAAPLVARWRFWETSAGDPVDVPFWLEVL
jgi:hypothetical protein